MTLQFFQRSPQNKKDGNPDTTDGFVIRPSPINAFYFPGGEPHIASKGEEFGKHQIAYLRGADGNELFQLAHWADFFEYQEKYLILPYLPGARADRGKPFGAEIYGRFIDDLRVNQVICLDPHSYVMPMMIDNVTKIYSYDLIRTSLGVHVDFVISPDEGSRERSSKAAKALGVPVFNASKHRDMATGKLSGFTCEPLPETGMGIIIDDICDGGGTFMGLAQATGLPKERLSLFVTHGIFSGQAKNLKDYFSHIITTDSFPGAALSVADRILPVRFHLEQHLRFQ